jgi:pimeloyl-ACP methyl ester carboxylesterase
MIGFKETTRDVVVDGVRLHYNECGEGPVLLCFHGGGPGANAWDNTRWNIEAISKRFRVILMDLPGYGGSQHIEPLEGESLEATYSRAIRAFMDALSIEKANFYGTSMSASIVVYFAVQSPDRVIRLVLKTPSAGPNILTVTPPDGIEALYDFRDAPAREKMDRIMRLFVPKPGLLTQEMIDARYASAEQARKHPRPTRELGPYEDLLPLLRRLSMPVLVFWGHQDRMVPLDGALMALAVIPDVQVHIWGSGTGHFIEFEHTEDFNHQVLWFLTKPEAQRGHPRAS